MGTSWTRERLRDSLLADRVHPAAALALKQPGWLTAATPSNAQSARFAKFRVVLLSPPMTNEGRTYTPPAVAVVGTVASVTQGFHTPIRELDGTYPSKTPVSNPIYS